MKTYDAIRPRLLPRLVAYSIREDDTKRQIELMQAEIIALANQLAEANSAKEREQKRKEFNEKQAQLRAFQKRREEQKKKDAELAVLKLKREEREDEIERQKAVRAKRREDIEVAVGVVAFIFVLTLAILWGLSRIDGPIKAEVKAVIERFGGKLWVTAVGLVGAFLAIAIVGVVSVYVLAQMSV